MNKAAVLAVLRQSKLGFANVRGHWSIYIGLTWWQRLLNWLLLKMGADQKPFIDPNNYQKVDILPLCDVADPKLINDAMEWLAEAPRCRICGGTNLAPDPAGYYNHAIRYDGAPLLCLDHHE